MHKILSFLGICLLACSCSTSKFDYNTAYKFSQYNYQQEQEQEHTLERPADVQALASLKPVVTATEATLPSDIALREMAQPAAKSAEAFKEYYNNASKSEKKAIRKQVRENYKSLRAEYKEAKEDSTNKDIVFNKKMFIGVVVLGAGILVAILASGPVGAIGIIVGIGFIAWGFIEQA